MNGYALGFVIVRRCADLSRETQRLLFEEATAGDDSQKGSRLSYMRSIPRRTICSVGFVSFPAQTRISATRSLRLCRAPWRKALADHSELQAQGTKLPIACSSVLQHVFHAETDDASMDWFGSLIL
jgi:hypothetical protein